MLTGVFMYSRGTFFFLLILSISVSARGEIIDEPETSWGFLVGGGVCYSPVFYGSRDYQLMAIPVIVIEYRKRLSLSMEGLGYNLINWNWLKIGTALKYDFGRNERGDELQNYFRIYGDEQPNLKGLGDVNGTAMPGGFAEFRFKAFAWNINTYKAINGHKSFTGKMGIKYNEVIPFTGFPLIFSIDMHTAFAGSGYNNAYYGIDEVQSERSGLESYNTGGGFISCGAGLFLMHPFTESISISAFGVYDRLSEEICNSPIIREYGCENQYMGGIMINYRWSY